MKITVAFVLVAVLLISSGLASAQKTTDKPKDTKTAADTAAPVPRKVTLTDKQIALIKEQDEAVQQAQVQMNARLQAIYAQITGLASGFILGTPLEGRKPCQTQQDPKTGQVQTVNAPCFNVEKTPTGYEIQEILPPVPAPAVSPSSLPTPPPPEKKP